MFPESQLEASLKIAKYASWDGFTVRLEPVGAWRGSPYFSQWDLLYPASLLLRRLRRRHEWRIVLLEGDEVIDEQEQPGRPTAETEALRMLRERTRGK